MTAGWIGFISLSRGIPLPGLRADMQMAAISSDLILFFLSCATTLLMLLKQARVQMSASCCDHFGLGVSGWYSVENAHAKILPVSTSTATDFVLVVPMSVPIVSVKEVGPRERHLYDSNKAFVTVSQATPTPKPFDVNACSQCGYPCPPHPPEHQALALGFEVFSLASGTCEDALLAWI